MDNNPLTYVLGKAKLDATSQRWIAALASNDLSLTYMCGKSNTVADSFSRLDQDRQELFSDAVKAMCDSILVSPSCPSAESILMTQSLDDLVDGNDLWLNEFCDVSWSDEQKRDIDIARVIELKRVGQKLTKRQISKESQYVRKLLYDWNRLIMKNGILYRISNMSSETTYQLVLPVDNREVVLKGLHDAAGHHGRDRTLYLVKSRSYWPGVNKDVENKVSTCPNYILRKTKVKNSVELVCIESCQPLELICIDFLSLEQSMLRQFLLGIRQLRLLSDVYGNHSFNITRFQRVYIAIKVGILSLQLLESCVRWLVLRGLERLRIILLEMVSVRGLTSLC